MDFIITSIITIIIILSLIVLLLKIAKVGVKWIIIIASILALLSIVFGINLFQDISELRENLPKAQNLILLKNNNIITGFTGNIISNNKVSYLNESQINSYKELYEKEDFDSMKDQYYKLIIIDKDIFDGDGKIVFNNHNVSVSKVISLIESNNALEDSVSLIISMENLIENNNLRNYIKDRLKSENGVLIDNDMKAILFASLINQEDKAALLNGVKTNKVLIYPNTITFKIVKIIPGILSENIIKKMVVMQ